MTRAGRLIISTFGLGLLRPAPGTWGSLPPCLLGAAVVIGAGSAAGSATIMWLWTVLQSACVLLFSWACVRFGAGAEAAFGRKDPSAVVADETAGMALTLLFMPWWWLGSFPADLLVPLRALAALVPTWLVPGDTLSSPATLAALTVTALAFLLFRLFDILKIPPARGLQRLTGGWGILIDDLIAAAQAGLTLLALCWVLTRA